MCLNRNNKTVKYNPNCDFIYRHYTQKLSKRQRENSDPKQQLNMIFISIPKDHRSSHQSQPEISDQSMDGSDMGTVQTGDLKSNVSGGMDNVALDLNEALPVMEALDDKIVQVDNFCNAS